MCIFRSSGTNGPALSNDALFYEWMPFAGKREKKAAQERDRVTERERETERARERERERGRERERERAR